MTYKDLLEYYYTHVKPEDTEESGIFGKRWVAFTALCDAHIPKNKNFVQFTSMIRSFRFKHLISLEDIDWILINKIDTLLDVEDLSHFNFMKNGQKINY